MSLRRGSQRMLANSDSRIPVVRRMAITAASRRCWNDRPAQARSSRSRFQSAKMRAGLSERAAASSQPPRRELFLVGQPLEELLQRTELAAGARGVDLRIPRARIRLGATRGGAVWSGYRASALSMMLMSLSASYW
jgi:hypothetical protein